MSDESILGAFGSPFPMARPTGHDLPRLVILVAAAGYGKTTSARRLASAWESHGYCDAFGVTNLAEFAGRLMTALSGNDELVAGRLGQQVAGIGSDATRLVEAARQAWRENAMRDSAIIIDHLEDMDAVDGLRELLNWLLERRHSNRTVILCSRVPLRLRFSRFALPHETLTLGADDLRLDLGQIRAILPADTSDSALREVDLVSQGWPIGVLYLARAARQQQLALVLHRLRNTSVDELEEYLTSEVIAKLDDRERIIVLAAAAVPNLSTQDVATILGCRTPEAARLLRTTPFVNVRGEGTFFEVHPLLRRVVYERERPAMDGLLRRLAHHYGEHEDGVRAAELFVAANDTRQAVQALSAAISSMKSTYLFRSPNPDLVRTIAALTLEDMLSAPLVWNVTSLARVYGISFAQWLEESRLVTSRLGADAPLIVRAGVVNNYANSAGMLGLFDEARKALEDFERTLADEDVPIGRLVADAWRLAIDVWAGVPLNTDLDVAQEHFSPIITADDGTMVLWHINVRARHARTHGDRHTEEFHLQRARAAAERASVPLVDAVVLSDIVVSAWFWGEDARFAVAIDELEQGAAVSVWDGVRHLIACCRGRAASEPVGFEQLNVRVFSFLIAATSTNSAVDAVSFVRQAIHAADAAASRFHQVIARVGLALLTAGSLQARLYAEALRFADQTRSYELIGAVKSVAAGENNTGMLSAFVGRFTHWTDNVHVSLFDLTVLRNAEPVKLTRREFELVVALALRRGGVARDWLADRFWPDKDTAEGLKSLKVYVHRLRQKLGTDVIVSRPHGYVLSSRVSVDLAEVERALSSARLSKELDQVDSALLETTIRRDIQDLQSSFAAFASLIDALPRAVSAIRDSGIALARKSLAREDWSTAAAHATCVFNADRCDELGAELLIRALAGAGDNLGATRVLREHDSAVMREFGVRAAERLRGLT